MGSRIARKAASSLSQLLDETAFELWEKWLKNPYSTWNHVIVIKVTAGAVYD